MQICIQPANEREDSPYTPTGAGTCSGESEDRVFVDETEPVQNPITVDLVEALGEDFAIGERIFFAVHVNIFDADGDDGVRRTTYAVGASEGEEQEQPATRALTVEKVVNDELGEEGVEFDFTVDCGDYALSDANNSGEGVTYSSGDATFSMADGEEQTFSAIPNGTDCTIEEADPGEQWSTTVHIDDGEPEASRTAEVTLDADHTVAFANDRSAAGAGGGEVFALTVTKDVVDGEGGEIFEFTVDCGDFTLSEDNNAGGNVTYSAGDATFSLTDEDSETFSEIADGTECTVTEDAPDADEDESWTTTVQVDDGSASEARTTQVTMSSDHEVTFTNQRFAVGGTQQEREVPRGSQEGDATQEEEEFILPATDVAERPAEVRGRQLAATGASSRSLAFIGFGLPALGGLLAEGSRNRGAHCAPRRFLRPLMPSRLPQPR